MPRNLRGYQYRYQRFYIQINFPPQNMFSDFLKSLRTKTPYVYKGQIQAICDENTKSLRSSTAKQSTQTQTHACPGLCFKKLGSDHHAQVAVVYCSVTLSTMFWGVEIEPQPFQQAYRTWWWWIKKWNAVDCGLWEIWSFRNADKRSEVGKIGSWRAKATSWQIQ